MSRIRQKRYSRATFLGASMALLVGMAAVFYPVPLTGAAQTPIPAQAPPAAAGSSEKEAPSKEAPPKSEAANPALPPGYRIGAGDSLEVNVWKEAEASATVVVRPDGKISLPLVKEIYVQGLTPVELEKTLAIQLVHFINNPDVTVVVRGIQSKKVYIVGAVNKVVPLLSDMTILQVLAEAGGPGEYAKRKKIYVMRMENGKQVKLHFNYDAVIKGERTEENIILRPDDTIVIPH